MSKNDRSAKETPAEKKIDVRNSVIMDWAQILMMAFIVVFGFIRPFIAEPYKIPSGSMENTLFNGDRVLVLKFSYGAKLPATSTRLFDFRGPQAGDVFVFSPKHSPLEHFIKRVVAAPGDEIASDGSALLINGKRLLNEEYAKPLPYANDEPFVNKDPSVYFPPFRTLPPLVPYYLEQPDAWKSVQEFIEREEVEAQLLDDEPTAMTTEDGTNYRLRIGVKGREYDRRIPVKEYYFVEADNGQSGLMRGVLYQNTETLRWTFARGRFYRSARDDAVYKIPDRHYFAMGDNRLNSQDSRAWGPVPYDVVKGKAVWIYWSNDPNAPRRSLRRWIRFDHIKPIMNRYGTLETFEP